MISANAILVNLEYFIGYHSGLLDIDPQITMNNSNETHEGLLPPALLVMYSKYLHPLDNLPHLPCVVHRRGDSYGWKLCRTILGFLVSLEDSTKIKVVGNAMIYAAIDDPHRSSNTLGRE